jgi:predicted DNA binding CopG/RHH family protein
MYGRRNSRMPKGTRQPRRPTATIPHEPVPPAALDEEEQEILRTVEAGEWDEVPHMEEEKRRIQTFFRQVAQIRRVTFRMTENDLYSLQIKARQEGIPYQALITSILHKYLTGQLVPVPKLEPARTV